MVLELLPATDQGSVKGIFRCICNTSFTGMCSEVMQHFLERTHDFLIFFKVGFSFLLYRITCCTDEHKLQSFTPKWCEGEANGRRKEKASVYWLFWLGYMSTSACPNQIQKTEVTQHLSLPVDVCHHSVIVLRHLCP